MAFGDVLRKKVYKLSEASKNKMSPNAFWIILRDIAKEDIIKLYPSSVDSDTAVPIYYQILLENSEMIPEYYKEKLASNNQERFRVINRNMFTSNAFHPDGLANQNGIVAHKEINESKKGERIVYQGEIKC